MAGKSVLTGLAALTLFDIVAAQAQTVPVYNWAGFYIGGHAGNRWADVSGVAPYAGLPVYDPLFGLPSFPLLSSQLQFDPHNGIYGVHGGYNFMSSTFLLGLEGDYSWGRGSRAFGFALSDVPNNTFGSNSFSTTIGWQASIRGRFGYTEGPWLFYGTAGVSFLRATMSGVGTFGGGNIFCFDGCAVFSTSSASSFSQSRTLVGGVIGGGIEYLFANYLMFRVEYLIADYGYANFGNVSVTSTYSDNFNCVCTITSTSSGNVSAHITTQTLRFGISAKLPP
jgi:opacity protein-like surface antigen